jgi:hypothetical protein
MKGRFEKIEVFCEVADEYFVKKTSMQNLLSVIGASLTSLMSVLCKCAKHSHCSASYAKRETFGSLLPGSKYCFPRRSEEEEGGEGLLSSATISRTHAAASAPGGTSLIARN